MSAAQIIAAVLQREGVGRDGDLHMFCRPSTCTCVRDVADLVADELSKAGLLIPQPVTQRAAQASERGLHALPE